MLKYKLVTLPLVAQMSHGTIASFIQKLSHQEASRNINETLKEFILQNSLE